MPNQAKGRRCRAAAREDGAQGAVVAHHQPRNEAAHLQGVGKVGEGSVTPSPTISVSLPTLPTLPTNSQSLGLSLRHLYPTVPRPS